METSCGDDAARGDDGSDARASAVALRTQTPKLFQEAFEDWRRRGIISGVQFRQGNEHRASVLIIHLVAAQQGFVQPMAGSFVQAAPAAQPIMVPVVQPMPMVQGQPMPMIQGQPMAR